MHHLFNWLKCPNILEISKKSPRGRETYTDLHEPGHEKMCLMLYANNKGADQTARKRSLISTFVVRCLDSITSLDSIAEISRR